MSNKLQVEYVDINSINPYPNNAKEWSPEKAVTEKPKKGRRKNG